MEKLKQVIRDINQKILERLEDKKNDFCCKIYSRLTNARNKLYSMLTRAIIEEAWKVIDHDISVLDDKRNDIKNKLNLIKDNAKETKSNKASRNTKVKENELVPTIRAEAYKDQEELAKQEEKLWSPAQENTIMNTI